MIEILIWGFIIYSCLRFANFLIALSSLSEVEKKIKAHLDEIIHNVNIEQVGPVQYWYDKDNNQFLCQGQTTEEIVSVLKSRFPDHIFLVEDKGILHGPDWKFVDQFDFAARKRHYGIK